ncbi:MAG: hypothetical protein IPM85_01990 [Chitinophagaceae bacterium]|nr:hypothetical protein [Chitinophagaceae bacterium]
MKYALSAFLLILLSCKKTEQPCGCVTPYQIYYLRAEVVQTKDINCGRPVLSFLENSVRIRTLTGQQDFAYIGEGLPAAMNQQSKKLYVDVRLLKPEETFACITYGISHPGIKILDAKER